MFKKNYAADAAKKKENEIKNAVRSVLVRKKYGRFFSGKSLKKTVNFLYDCYLNMTINNVFPRWDTGDEDDYIPNFGNPMAWMNLCLAVANRDKPSVQDYIGELLT